MNNSMNISNKKVGRPRAYTPEALEAKFEEYANWVKANPVYINKVSAGEIIPVSTQRPLTLVGFCRFAKISRQNFYEYESREEFSDILTCVREAIEADQLQGAIVGFYDSGIIARVLHLADRQDVTTNGKAITAATQPISVLLDPEAAKIIQSIGKMTVKE
ncbi:terminase small subunit [Alistipes shahii]|uniref:terminase small subunit n=1 Tax=Alistipes shahii TaxID=328814 RepID=UPI003CF8FB64